MSGLLSYSGIVTKVRAMKVRLLSEEEYERIVNLEDVSEFLSHIKQNPNYAQLFGTVDEQRIHRGQIEHLLGRTLFDDYTKIYNFCNHDQRKILDSFFLLFETQALKRFLLNLHHQDEDAKEFLYLDFFKRHSDLPMEKLIGLKSLDEFVQSLKGTKYYKVLASVLGRQNATLFDYEMQLDIFYYKHVWEKKGEFLKGTDLRVITDVLGHKIDLLNLLWIYRFKAFYPVDAAKIYASILPVQYKLTKEQISAMVESANVEEFMALVEKSYYQRYQKENATKDFELLFRIIIKKVYKRNARRYPNSISPIYEFLYLKEREIDKLTTALECVRYRMNPEESLAILKD